MIFMDCLIFYQRQAKSNGSEKRELNKNRRFYLCWDGNAWNRKERNKRQEYFWNTCLFGDLTSEDTISIEKAQRRLEP